jgi:hypothetical protein
MASVSVLSLAVVFGLALPGISLAQGEASEKYITATEMLEPNLNSANAEYTEVALSDVELEALRLGVLELREKVADAVNNNPPMEFRKFNEIPKNIVKPTSVSKYKADDAEVPSSFMIGRNVANTRARTQSTLAEPAAANEGKFIFYMGNTYATYSIDGGATWVDVPIPAGPADAPTACCDPDAIYDRARGIVFWSILYVNASLNNGVVRIFVRPVVNAANTCSYDIDPGGAANNLLPDYPHLGLSNDFVYLTTNNITNGNWSGSQVRRFNADQMASCVVAATNTFTHVGAVGQRVFVPAEGARETMYWGAYEAANSMRIFSWPEANAAPVSVLRNVSAANFANPDCRGGTGNFDFIERSTAWSIAGFRMRSAIGAERVSFYINAGPEGAVRPQAHVRAAVFRTSDLGLVTEPHIWNPNFCFGFPAVSTNARGDLGLTIAAGGKAGGGGSAAQGYVGLDDDYTAGIGVFGNVILTAAGTHNRSDGRFGDYFTIHPHSPAGLFFSATNYSLSGGTNPANVNARYVEFGRERDKASYLGWRNSIAAP